MTIWNYPVSFPYGATDKPYSSTNPHKGDDRAAPMGTPVTVNGVVIGTVGTTGLSTGPHLHVGRYKSGVAVNPNGGGGTFQNAVVAEIHLTDDGANGKFVKVEADGALWYYLHLDSVKVKVGQRLGEDMTSRTTAIWLLRTLQHKHSPSDASIKSWTGLDDKQLAAKLENVYNAAWFKAQSAKINNPVDFVPVTEQLYKEKA